LLYLAQWLDLMAFCSFEVKNQQINRLIPASCPEPINAMCFPGLLLRRVIATGF